MGGRGKSNRLCYTFSMFLKQKIKLWLPVIVWCIVIFILSSIPTLPSPKILWWDFVLKKSAHMIEYGILYFLFFRAVNDSVVNLSGSVQNPQASAVKKAIPFIFCLFYAISDEYHQSFVPGRHAKVMDIGFDFLGMVISNNQIKGRADDLRDNSRGKDQNMLTESVKETQGSAAKLLRNLKGRNLVCLYGPLGSGKTTFVQGLAKALGIKKRVVSPTYVLLREYPCSARSKPGSEQIQSLIHIDCYRLNNEDDFKSVELKEILNNSNNLVVIEWAERIRKILPKERIEIKFDHAGKNKRKIDFNY